MRKNVFGRKLKRDTNERTALFKGLLSSLVLEERIKTTEQKAKSVRSRAEKLITSVKKENSNVSASLNEFLTPRAVSKLKTTIAPRYGNRSGGYTRIIRLGRRFNDNASMVFLEWVESNAIAMTNGVSATGELKGKTVEKDMKKNTTKTTKEPKKQNVKSKKGEKKA